MLSRHRLLVAVCGALAALCVAQAEVAVAAPAPTGIGWTVIDRYGGDPDGDGKLDGAGKLNPADLNKFAVRVLPTEAVCQELEQAVWRVDERTVKPVLEPGESCGAVVRVRGEGEHKVRVFARNREEVARVTVDDRLIVALGDSVASGEGNPEGSKHEWLERPCHRSAAAGFEQAARQLGEVDRRRSVTFVSLACSGARIDKGLLGAYAGIEPRADSEYPPQVDRLRRIAGRRSAEDGEPAVDAVLLSVGANDVRFAEIAERCAWFDRCPERVKTSLEQRIDELAGGYDELGEALDAAAPDTPVLISDYYDPTHGEDEHFCPGPLATSREESKWAYDHVLRPLNAEVAAAAERNAWQRVGGIAADFRLHGYCAKKKPWVRTLPKALALEDPEGTLHPNEEGHRAIAKRVARPLAALLGFRTPADPPEADEGGGIPDVPTWIVFLLLVVFAYPAARALMIMRPTWPEDPAGVKRARPEIAAVQAGLSLRYLLLIALGILVALGAMLILAGLAGRAILWLRFWSAHLPADQAVRAVSAGELVSTGSAALAIFLGLGLLAATLAWLLDANGREVRATRRGLIAIGLAEVVAAIWIGDFRRDQQVQLFFGLLAAALLLHYLVDRFLEWRHKQRSKSLASGSTASPAQGAWESFKNSCGEFLRRDESRLLRIWKVAPFLLLAVALFLSTWTDGTDRRLVLVAYALAAMAFAAPGGLAAPGVRWRKLDEPAKRSLTLPRIALALTGVALVVVFLVRDEPWFAGVVAVAVVLGLLCLAVAAVSGNRFAPYGLAVLASVPLFAGAAAFLHGVDSPELQPVAAILDDGEAVCGAYVGESDGQLWLARIVLDDDAGNHRPQRGAIEPIEVDGLAARSLGPLEPVDLVDLRARQLRDELLEEAGDGDPVKRTPSCEGTPAMRESIAGSEGRPSPDPDLQLAETYQPELIVDRHDRFWPVPVETLFSIRDRRSTICRLVAAGDCLRLGTPGEFPWIGGQGESLEYPAADNDPGEQHDQMVGALGTADPEASATEYYLVHRTPDGPISIQYWFFYPFNYQPNEIAAGGFHEGDFEAIGVLLSKAGEPRYVWMNRHNAEGRAFPWADEALSRPDGHPRVFAARGSHATYENCEGQVRPFDITGLIDDHPTCDEGRQLHLMPEVTPLVDLSRVGWACWQGFFGHRNGGAGIYEGSNKFLIADAPKSPLWQQKFGGVEKQPCLGISDPGGRDGPGEEVLEEGSGVPAKLREGASPLENAIDDCSDWMKPATSGIYMVACNQYWLKHYVESGLEDDGGAKVRIEAVGSKAPPPEPLPVPAVRRNRHGAYLSDWRIAADRQATVTVFASCPSTEGVVSARFEDVVLQPGEPLTLRDQGPGGTWLLVPPAGGEPWEAVPFTNRAKEGILVPRAPRPGKYLPCEAEDG
ncbi:MAG TPA: SGNH/GDSL hydrolase family protein [Solirubrobacterales bacterium]|nr:SGNH/GDSL hydrolase family protein [Solirubrobacterales bacterium]